MSEITEIIDHTGQVRHMGLNPVSDRNLMMRASRQAFKAHLESIGRGLIPRSKWVPIDRRKVLDTKFINDQKSSSGCTGWSAVQGLMRLRALQGMEFKKLSGAFIYALINGGRDQGSVIVDALEILETVGTCLESEMNFPNIYERDISPIAREDAKRFRLMRGLTCDTFDEACTAIQLGFIVQFPIMVGQKFETFSDGIAGFTNGYGNHSVHADGMTMVNGKWVLDMPNSWGVNWGPFKNGRCYIEERAFAGQGGMDDSYIHVDATFDPQDPNLPGPPA